jgi:Transglutaminase-like superfamily
MRPREVVHKMVDYFRAFAPSEEPPSGRGDIYLDLALSKKGVCRHRAFAFLVTALGIGVPARMVVNEAHAWVEVYDAKLWHRVDLGGAAANLQNDPDPNKPPYIPPPDPYAWPSSRDSGQDLADRNRAQQPQSGGSDKPANDATAGDAGAPMAAPMGSATGTTDPPESKLPESDVTVGAIDGDVHRGLPLHLQGLVTNGGAPCAHLRVDVVIVSHSPHGGGKSDRASREPIGGIPVGSLSTDERGQYDGAVVVPRDLPLGDYDLVVQTQGDARCGGGHSR